MTGQDRVEDFTEIARALLRDSWRWWETWVSAGLFIVVVSAIVLLSMQSRLFRSIQEELGVIETQNEKARVVRAKMTEELKQAGEDRMWLKKTLDEADKARLREIEYVHQEMDYNRAVLQKLEERWKSELKRPAPPP